MVDFMCATVEWCMLGKLIASWSAPQGRPSRVYAGPAHLPTQLAVGSGSSGRPRPNTRPPRYLVECSRQFTTRHLSSRQTNAGRSLASSSPLSWTPERLGRHARRGEWCELLGVRRPRLGPSPRTSEEPVSSMNVRRCSTVRSSAARSPGSKDAAIDSYKASVAAT